MPRAAAAMGSRRTAPDKPPAPPSPNPFLGLLSELKPQVERQLEQLFDSALKGDGAQGREVYQMLQAARALTMRGGKRLRAGLVLAGMLAVKGKKSRNSMVLASGAAIELIQSYFLIHDDWMDQDATRRGGPSVHTALAREFDSTHLGACGAILAGDYLMTLGTEHLLQACKRHPQSDKLYARFCELQRAAVVGQQLDVISQTKDAELVYQLKTSSYTVSGPLALGAILAEASPAQLKALDSFGLSVGIAFQLRDDLLGLFGDPEHTGKPQGNDLCAGKWTWTVQYALAQDNTAHASAIRSVLGQPKPGPRKLLKALKALEESGARTATEQRIQHHRERAMQLLERASFTPKGKQLLAAAAAALIDRST